MARARPLSLLVGLFGALALAASVPRDVDQPATAPPKILSFPVSRVPHDEARPYAHRAITRRQSGLDADFTDFNYSSILYLVELELGSPGQPVKVSIDTGSSELWVNPDCNELSLSQMMNECSASGAYNPDNSTSVHKYKEKNKFIYGSGKASVRYYRDDIALPDLDIDLRGVNFGVATQSNSMSHGILGLSFGKDKNLGYDNFVDKLVKQEIIDTRTVGIALAAREEADGGLLTFGAVDTKKFVGDLHTAPVLDPEHDDDPYRYWVNLNKLAITYGEGDSKIYSDEEFPVYFDTDSTLSYLPQKIVKALAKDLKATEHESSKMMVLPCDHDGTIHFTFGNYTIDVGLREFMWELSDGKTCLLGADADDETEETEAFCLGASFLRSVYTIYDMDTPAIHFAPYTNCGTNLQEIPKGKNAAQFKGECPGDDSGASRYAVGRAPMWLSVALAATYHIAGPPL